MAISTLHRQALREDQSHCYNFLNLIYFEFLLKTKAYLFRKKEAAFLKNGAVDIIFGDLKYEVRANVSCV